MKKLVPDPKNKDGYGLPKGVPFKRGWTQPRQVTDTERKAIIDAIADRGSGFDYRAQVFFSMKDQKQCGQCSKAMGNFVQAYGGDVWYFPFGGSPLLGKVLPNSLFDDMWKFTVWRGEENAKTGERFGVGGVKKK